MPPSTGGARRRPLGKGRGSDATTGLQGAKWTLWNKFHKVMTPSQAAMADARRNKLCDAYAAVREAARERQREYHGNQHDKPQAGLVEQIPQVHATNDDAEAAIGKPPAPKTRDIRAKAAGTNAKYIDLTWRACRRPDCGAAEAERLHGAYMNPGKQKGQSFELA